MKLKKGKMKKLIWRKKLIKMIYQMNIKNKK